MVVAGLRRGGASHQRGKGGHGRGGAHATPVQVPAAMADLLYVRRGEGRDVVVTTLGRRRSPGREHAQMADKLGENGTRTGCPLRVRFFNCKIWVPSYTRVALCSTLTASGPPYSSRFSSKESVKYNTTSLLNYSSSVVVASAMTGDAMERGEQRAPLLPEVTVHSSQPFACSVSRHFLLQNDH